MLRAAMGYLTTADAAQMAAGEQAGGAGQVFRAGHRDGQLARTSILAAFTSGQGYCADADYSPRAWLSGLS